MPLPEWWNVPSRERGVFLPRRLGGTTRSLTVPPPAVEILASSLSGLLIIDSEGGVRRSFYIKNMLELNQIRRLKLIKLDSSLV